MTFPVFDYCMRKFHVGGLTGFKFILLNDLAYLVGSIFVA